MSDWAAADPHEHLAQRLVRVAEMLPPVRARHRERAHRVPGAREATGADASVSGTDR
jgi:hypothetical protein